MTSPSHGEDRRFNSGRAHQLTSRGRIAPVVNNIAGFGLFTDAGSIPAEPTIRHGGRIAPVVNNLMDLVWFTDAGSIPAEPTNQHERLSSTTRHCLATMTQAHRCRLKFFLKLLSLWPGMIFHDIYPSSSIEHSLSLEHGPLGPSRFLCFQAG